MHTRQKKKKHYDISKLDVNNFWYAKSKQVSSRMSGIDEQSCFFIIHYSFSAALMRRSCLVLHAKLIWMVLQTFKIDVKKVFFSGIFFLFLIFCRFFSPNTCCWLLFFPRHEFCLKKMHVLPAISDRCLCCS